MPYADRAKRREAQRRYDRAYDRRNPARHAARSLRRRGGTVTLSDVKALYDMGGGCAYCGAPAEHVDHATPLARGGSGGPENLVLACATCNCSKGTQTVLEFTGLWPSAECPF